MPLPDAEDPKTSNLYAQLRTSQLETLDTDDFNKVKDPTYVNFANEDEARRMLLWGLVGDVISLAGPMPGTAAMKTHTANGATNVTVFQPNTGEVWLLGPASVDPEGSGSYRVIPTLTSTSGTSVEIADISGTGAAEGAVAIDWPSPIYLTKEVFLKANFITVDTSLAWKCQVIRVR